MQARALLPNLTGPWREYSHEMISSPWFLLLVGAAGASVTMICVWLVSIRIANASYVDVAWALGIAGTAVVYALLAEGSTLHRVLVAGLGTIWGVRLGTYLLARLAGKEEDGRYQELRRRWAPHVNRSFFVFFQAQAAFILVFSLPFAFVAADRGEMTWLAWVAPRSRSRPSQARRPPTRSSPSGRAIPRTRARPPATASGAGRAIRTTSSSGCTGSRGPSSRSARPPAGWRSPFPSSCSYCSSR